MDTVLHDVISENGERGPSDRLGGGLMDTDCLQSWSAKRGILEVQRSEVRDIVVSDNPCGASARHSALSAGQSR